MGVVVVLLLQPAAPAIAAASAPVKTKTWNRFMVPPDAKLRNPVIRREKGKNLVAGCLHPRNGTVADIVPPDDDCGH
jgi:hypothetical protein